MKTIDDVKILYLKSFSEKGVEGELVPIEFSELPFQPQRAFYVYGVKGKGRQVRGKHAHYKTEQILICLRGSCLVSCKDGSAERGIVLPNPKIALHIPEMIWDEQEYLSEDTILLVLLNTPYNKEDYIEDWDQFLALR